MFTLSVFILYFSDLLTSSIRLPHASNLMCCLEQLSSLNKTSSSPPLPSKKIHTRDVVSCSHQKCQVYSFHSNINQLKEMGRGENTNGTWTLWSPRTSGRGPAGATAVIPAACSGHKSQASQVGSAVRLLRPLLLAPKVSYLLSNLRTALQPF